MGDMSAALARFQASYQNSTLPRVDASDKDRLKEVAQEFEAIFVKQMLDSMRKNLKKEDDLLDGGMAQDIFQDMLYTEYSRLMSKTGNFGIADSIYKQYDRAVPKSPYGT